METKFTPGPWRLAYPLGKPEVVTDGAAIECKRICFGLEKDFYDNTAAANGLLIAASPDLLAACQGILANFHESVTTTEELAEFPALKAVSDAITKATQESPSC